MEQINLVNGGLNVDSEEHFQPEGTIRYGLNGMIYHLGGENYSWENKEGNKVSFSICEPTFTPIGWCVIRDKDIQERLIVFSAADAGNDGEVGVVTFNENGTGTYKAHYRKAELNFSTDNPIECFGIYENEHIQRVYWTDRFRNAPRCMSLVLTEPIAITVAHYLTGITEFTTGVEYLVNCGAIVETLISSGATVTYVAGDTFTVDYTLYVYTGVVNSSVSVYFPYQLLDYTPKQQLGEIDHIKRIGGGYLYYGTYFFAYLLGTNDGFETDWSYLAGPVPILVQNGMNTYDAYQTDQANAFNVNSGNGLELQIDNLQNGVYNYVKICVFFSNDNNVSGTGTIIAKIPITSTSVIFDYYGNENLGTVTIDDVSINTISIEGVKTITPIKYHNINANIQERSELSGDITGSIDVGYYKMPIDQTAYFETDTPGTEALFGTYPVIAGLATSGYIANHQWYEVVTALTYNGVSYLAGDCFQGTTVTTFTVGTCKPIILYKRYTGQIVAIVDFVVQNFYFVYAGSILDNTTGITYVVGDFFQHQAGHTYTDAASTIKDCYVKSIAIADYLDYKGLASSRYLKGYWGEENYRVGILPYDDYGKHYFVRWIADKVIPVRDTSAGGIDLTEDDVNIHITANIAHLVASVDLTDIIDDISGFSIVVAPRQAKILSEGILMATCRRQQPAETDSIRPMRCLHAWNEYVQNEDTPIASYDWRKSFFYEYYSPEHLFNYSVPQLQVPDTLRIARYVNDPSWDLDAITPPPVLSYGATETTNYHFCNKLYNITIPNFVTAPVVGTENKIIRWITNIAVGQDVSNVDGILTYKNRTNFAHVTRPAMAGGGSKTLITLETDDGILGFGDWGYYSDQYIPVRNTVPIVNHVRHGANDYGGTSPNALASTKYMWVGHYQKVDAAFKAAIKVGSTYIVNNIDVFGGDCFICMFDYARLMKDNALEDGGGSDEEGYSHAIIVPLQSNINIAMRYGHHIGKNRSWEHTFTPDVYYHRYSGGIGYTTEDANTYQYEEFLYNKAYSSTYLSTFAALPIDFYSVGRFDMRSRFSEIKIPGEIIDHYRVFPANNFRDVDTWAGQINNVKNKQGRLYYWQDRAVGYMPINEKTMMTDPLGGQVQLGVGGEFTSFEQQADFYGNQHQWGLVEVEDGFCWVDFRRRSFIYMTTRFGITETSIKKGISSILHDSLFNDLTNNDNCIKSGIVCGFDSEYRNVYITLNYFPQIGTIKQVTIVYDTLSQKFVGLFDSYPTLYISCNAFFFSAMGRKGFALVNNRPYDLGDVVYYLSINYICISAFTYTGTTPNYDTTHWAKVNELKNVWIHNHNDLGKFYGIVKDSVIEIVVNKNTDIAKVFDNVILQGNEAGFTSLQARTVDQTVTENITDLSNNIINRNYEYVKKAWYFSIPLYLAERLQGDWLALRFTFNNKAGTNPTVSRDKKIKFTLLKTLWRKFF